MADNADDVADVGRIRCKDDPPYFLEDHHDYFRRKYSTDSRPRP